MIYTVNRTAIFLLVWLIAFPASAQEKRPDLLSDVLQNAEKESLEIDLIEFFDRESRFPKRFAVKSVFSKTMVGDDSNSNQFFYFEGVQYLVVDEDKKIWRACEEFRNGESREYYEGFFDGSKFFERQTKLSGDPWRISKPAGFNSRSVGFINPRRLWDCNSAHASNTWLNSKRLTLESSCFASAIEKSVKRRGLFALEKCIGPNLITEVVFDQNSLPVMTRNYPAILGDFEATKAMSEFRKYTASAKWPSRSWIEWISFDTDQYAIRKCRSERLWAGFQREFTVTNEWVFDETQIEKFLQDPRAANAASLSDIRFGKEGQR